MQTTDLEEIACLVEEELLVAVFFSPLSMSLILRHKEPTSLPNSSFYHLVLLSVVNLVRTGFYDF